LHFILPIAIFFVWFVWVYACAVQCELRDVVESRPDNEKSGTSLFPGIPIFPLFFWGLAEFINSKFINYGTYSILFLHAILLIALIISIFYMHIKTKRLKASISYETPSQA
jgi:hypothetical protein